ncbi:MAG: PAS domain S-box protein [Bacteroidales bacterium]|nr:PAS domain S-box protein [Bacteroidales bacterium]MCF8391477.1 PAS domain S-box protein [Bacteroidales bacterium]
MNYFKSIAIKSSILLIALTIYWLWAGLGFADRLNQFTGYEEMVSNFYESIVLAQKIETQTFVLIETASPGINKKSSVYSGELEQLLMNLLTNISLINEDNHIQKSLALKRNSKLLEENCSEINRIHNEYLILLSKKEKLKSLLSQQLESEENSDLSFGFQHYLLSYNPEIIDDILDGISPERKAQSLLSEELDVENPTDPIYLLKEILSLDYKIGFYNKSALTGELILFSKLISRQFETFLSDYEDLYEEEKANFYRRFYFALFLTGLLILSALFLYYKSILRNINKLKSILQNLSLGRLNKNFNSSQDAEFSELFSLTNSITDSLIEKKSFVESLSEGNDVLGQHEFPPEDELGNKLDKMARKFELTRIEEDARKEERRIRSWHSEGLAQFGEIFRSERNDLKELSFKVIKMLVDYLNANQGILYIVNDDDAENQHLEAMAAFAFDRRKYPETRILFGEGLVGTCAIEKESIYINEVPEDYIQITSGLGEAPPRAILIVPLKIENEIFGIIEIASFSEFRDYAINFTEQLAESIATTLAGVRINQKTNLLLEQSIVQSKNMAEQEKIMNENLEAFKQAQEESKRKENEISGILNAINASALVAEFSLNGRFSDLNSLFIELLEISKEQAIGKHHSDFAEVEKYSEEYKKFWRDLRDGEIIHKTEKYKLFSGNEIWLKQTFTPIQDGEGNTIKILNISSDITQTIIQENTLKGQSGEIARSNTELKSLSQAVDNSILKCEYSPDGIIIDANNNYCSSLGYSLKEMIGKNSRIFLKEDEKEQFNTIISEVLKGKHYSGVVKRSKPTGEEIWLMANFTPVLNEEGSIYKIYFLSQDVTEKKLKYQLLEEANREIDRLKNLLESLQKK